MLLLLIFYILIFVF